MMPRYLTYLKSIANGIESISIFTGKAGSLILPLLIVIIVINVMLRYLFNIGLVELEEVQWHLNAMVVMSCLAYTYQKNEHVRVDVIRNRLSPRKQAMFEILGLIFLFFPFTLLVSWHAWHMAEYSWSLREGSPMPSGLPARYIIKGIMALGISLLSLQGLAIFLNCLYTLFQPTHKQESIHE